MAAFHSTSKMLASMIAKGDVKITKSPNVSDVMNLEQSDTVDAPQPKLIAQPQPKLSAQPKPSVDLGQALTNILGPNATKQHSPMDKTSG